MENENLFKEIQAYPELNSPLNFFPIINHDLEKYNSKYRNAEKSKIFSSVLFGFDKNSNDSSLLSGELIWKNAHLTGIRGKIPWADFSLGRNSKDSGFDPWNKLFV